MPLVFSICSHANAPAPELILVASGFEFPLAMAESPDGTGRLFVVEQAGYVRRVDRRGHLEPEPFIDLTDRTALDGERGLLAIAFPPDYSINGEVYLSYTTLGPSFSTTVSRFSVMPTDPDRLDPDTEEVLLSIDQPRANHNGGDLHFDWNGDLYIGVGDSGGPGDPDDTAQDRQSLLGKILRISPHAGAMTSHSCGPQLNYSIPPDNPFFNGGGCSEIWTLGLRHPYRFTVDSVTSDLFIGDVGQDGREEIDRVPAHAGGLNMGWDCREGLVEYFRIEQQSSVCSQLPAPEFVDPILEYVHENGRCSVTGGVVYRGRAQAWDGSYFYGDFCTGEIFVMREPFESGASEVEVIFHPLDQPGYCPDGACLTSFGQDLEGEAYVIDRGGRLFHINLDGRIFLSGFER